MPRKKSTNPAAILSVSLPLTTRSKIDKFNPRNRSQFFNEAVLQYINRNDREAIEMRMNEEANIDLENPRIDSASVNKLLKTLSTFDLVKAAKNNEINPAYIEPLKDLIKFVQRG